MDDYTIFPWQQSQWNVLWNAKQKNCLSHAILLAGASGLGKKQFAAVFSAALLCDESDKNGKICGKCHNCSLIRAKSHPDLHWIVPESAGQMIKIDQIRHIVSTANETAMQGKFKIIIIHPAHAMNQYAANALLKTLEEAAPNTLFILISEQNLRLPLTIQSRCQKIVFQKPKKQDALDWLRAQDISRDLDLELLLNLSQGAPLRALSLIEKDILTLRQNIYRGLFDLSQGQSNPLQLAMQWQEYDMIIIFHLILYWLRDLLRFQLMHEQAVLVNSDYQTCFSHIIQMLSRKNILNYIEFIQERYANFLNLQNLNRQLLLEELLIQWTQYYVSR